MNDSHPPSALRAGWYFDPENPLQLRWFDGAVWTDDFELLPPPPRNSTVEEPNPFTDSFVIKTAVPTARSWHAETGAKFVPDAGAERSTADLPADLRGADDDVDEDAVIGATWTVETWVLALLPAIAYAVQWALAKYYPGVFLETPWTFWIVPAALVVAGPLLAIIDRQSLKARHVTTAPNSLVGVLPPVYLLMRAVSVGASSIPPLIVWCVVVLALYSVVEPSQNLISGFLALVSPAP